MVDASAWAVPAFSELALAFFGACLACSDGRVPTSLLSLAPLRLVRRRAAGAASLSASSDDVSERVSSAGACGRELLSSVELCDDCGEEGESKGRERSPDARWGAFCRHVGVAGSSGSSGRSMPGWLAGWLRQRRRPQLRAHGTSS